MLRAISFLALLFTALALVPYWAQPNKIGMTQEHYFVAQRTYDNWALLSLVLFPAMAFNIALAYLLRDQSTAFGLAMAGCLCMAATLLVFFFWTYPANAATQNWLVAPANWQELRRDWEYSHAFNALLAFASFCLMTLAVWAARR